MPNARLTRTHPVLGVFTFREKYAYNLIFWHFRDISRFDRIIILPFSFIYPPTYNLFDTFYLFNIPAADFPIYTFFNQNPLHNTPHSL